MSGLLGCNGESGEGKAAVVHKIDTPKKVLSLNLIEDVKEL